MKKQLIEVLKWTWAALLILCIFAVFFVSWIWTIVIVIYVVVSLVVLNFVAGPGRPDEER